MPRQVKHITCFCWLLTAIILTLASGQGNVTANEEQETADKTVALQASLTVFQKQIAPLLQKHCSACHGAETQEKELNLAQLDPNMESTSAARWAMVLDQVVLGKMPPDGQPALSEQQVEVIVTWIKAEMKRTGKHLARRQESSNGNVIPHELLFDPKQAGPIDVPTGVRRLSPEIYGAFVGDVGKRATGVSQPFSPSVTTTFPDMGAAKIDEPTTQSLLKNALRIVAEQTSHKIENGAVVKVGSPQTEFLRLFDPQNPPSDEDVRKAVATQFDRVLRRQPTAAEAERFLALYHKNLKDAGQETGVRYTLAAVFLLPEAVYRWEVGAGSPDAQGRVRLAPREIAFALSYALTDKRPENWLLDCANRGQLDTQAGVAKAVQQLLETEKTDKPRILRFFREYFQYDQATEIFKDKGDNNSHDPRTLVEDTDQLVRYILQRDQQVLYELLTTNQSFVAYKIAADLKKQRAEAVAKFEQEKLKNPEKFKGKEPRLPGRSIFESYSLTDFPDQQPVALSADQRAGILTQPSWLVAWSKSDENDAIHRGKWIRERLLGGVVPDIPITVDAQLPEAPEKTLRQRMEVTRQEYCWQCHTFMNQVGLPFEMFDHFGRYRTAEPVLDVAATQNNVDKKGKSLGPVLHDVALDASGSLDHTGDAALQGEVQNAVELMHKLAKSTKVEQVFVRHAFRYWMGRNETLGDAATLQAAHQA